LFFINKKNYYINKNKNINSKDNFMSNLVLIGDSAHLHRTSEQPSLVSVFRSPKASGCMQLFLSKDVAKLALSGRKMRHKLMLLKQEIGYPPPQNRIFNISSFVVQELFSYLKPSEMRNLALVDDSMATLSMRENMNSRAFVQQIESRHKMTYREYQTCLTSGMMPSPDKIDSLEFDRISAGDEILRAVLKRYPNRGEEITDVSLEALAPLINLTHLKLSPCTRITDVGLQALAPLINLTYLDLSDCRAITEVGVETLVTLTTNLKTLIL
jgi:hypothetical protein